MLRDGYHDVPDGKIAMVITHYKMGTPHLRHTPLPDGLTFARIRPDVATYRDLFARVGESWLWFGRRVMSDDTLRSIITDPDVHIHTLVGDGQPEAILELDFRAPGMCELSYFGVTPALIGTGAGGYLMDRAIEMASVDGITRFQLNTCTLDSPQAIGFYERSGFVPVKRQVEVADDPRIAHGYDANLAPHVPLITP